MDYRLGFGLFLLCGGLLAAIGGIEQRLRRRGLIRRAVRVEARVVSVKTEYAGEDGGRDTHVPTVEFRVAGEVTRAPTIAGRVDAVELRPGKVLVVWYDPSEPGRVVLSPDDWAGGGCATFLGMLMAGIGAGLVWVWHTAAPD